MSDVDLVNQYTAKFDGPIGSDVKDIRQQLTGGRDQGQYPGWPQLGNRSVTDALAAIGAHLGISGFYDPLARNT
ncbi:hypothetical protein [Williamsia herbipolensis]|uniref:hypothetical protein n=1 Tax=Williamsia herbipolensis TaxID=1603258 RepID=UPI0009E36ED2|nr:hypothetical protein [Williamsia herbipolensis]